MCPLCPGQDIVTKTYQKLLLSSSIQCYKHFIHSNIRAAKLSRAGRQQAMALLAATISSPLVHLDEKTGSTQISAIRPERLHLNIQVVEALRQVALIQHEPLTLLWVE